MVEWMGRNFDVFTGFHKITCYALYSVGQIWPVLEAMVNTTGRHETLDNTLRLRRRLSETMFLEEATRWLRTFESYLAWNELVIEKKSPKCIQKLLESFLDGGLVSRLAEDESITERTTVRGPTGILSTHMWVVGDHPQHQEKETEYIWKASNYTLTKKGADNHSEEGQHKEHWADPTSNHTTTTTQYQSWTTMETSNPRSTRLDFSNILKASRSNRT
jgi:hypothetical protein